MRPTYVLSGYWRIFLLLWKIKTAVTVFNICLIWSSKKYNTVFSPFLSVWSVYYFKVHFFKERTWKNQFIQKFAKTALPYSCKLKGQFLQILGWIDFVKYILKKQTLVKLIFFKNNMINSLRNFLAQHLGKKIANLVA